MRIDPTRAAHVSRVQSSPAKASAGQPTGPSQRSDAVELSGRVSRLRRVRDAAAAAPDVRAERVAAIKAEVQAGTYQVDTDRLAAKLLDHI